MARTQARFHGFPRGRRSSPANLKEELRRRTQILRIEAPLGIVGIPGSGRKTLAYRFGHLNRGILEEGDVHVAYCYAALFGAQFPPEASYMRIRRYSLRLTAYIIDPPAELPVHEPPLYWEHWNNFCCLVFAFDVRNQTSFREVSSKLTGYRQQNYRIPTCLIAGNKCDRRHEPPSQPVDLNDPEYLNQREVFERTAYMEAERLNAFYFECSAKKNIDILPLLNFIKLCAIDRKYWNMDPE